LTNFIVDSEAEADAIWQRAYYATRGIGVDVDTLMHFVRSFEMEFVSAAKEMGSELSVLGYKKLDITPARLEKIKSTRERMLSHIT
jgi:hypothetical protein